MCSEYSANLARIAELERALRSISDVEHDMQSPTTRMQDMADIARAALKGE